MAIKSLQELNNDFIEKNQAYEHCVDERKSDGRSVNERGFDGRSAKTILPEKKKIFIAIMAIPLLLVLFFGAVAANSNNCFGYSFFSVLTNSMYGEIPKGSLIVVRQTDPQLLNTGDNITYIRDRTTTVTHKIIEIHENYNDSGARGFKTMGINNTKPDTGIVYANNIIGVVSFCIPMLGSVLAYIADNVGIICILLGGITAAVIAVRRILLGNTKQSNHGPIRILHTLGEKTCY